MFGYEHRKEIQMADKYGFFTEEYPDGSKQRTLMTGDGKSTFTDVLYEDGTVGIGIAYGFGEGLNTTTEFEEGTKTTELDIDLVVRFENPDSIDAMIRTLNDVKSKLL